MKYLPNSNNNLPKLVQNFAKFKTNPKNSQQLVKFCQNGDISTYPITLLILCLLYS